MKPLGVTSLVACIAAMAVLAGAAGAGTQSVSQPLNVAPAPVFAPSSISGVPVDALPSRGQCKIWYDALPAERQPAQMDCEHAQWLARTWGGRVIDHEREVARYEGRNDFSNIPVRALPQRGFCRAWLNGVDESAQPAESDCRVARQIADREHGRVIFIPI